MRCVAFGVRESGRAAARVSVLAGRPHTPPFRQPSPTWLLAHPRATVYAHLETQVWPFLSASARLLTFPSHLFKENLLWILFKWNLFWNPL